ncbi:MAG: type II toxin-antitoxin system HigB family toxin [Chloroflexota bacterium]|nr:type II toxin-antitoxin system HigB family toxin [Chloroflexota bacterium]
MRILTKKRVRDYWEMHPQAEQPLKRWHDYVRKAQWSAPADVKRDYHTADILPNNRVVFNIGGNNYRVIVKIEYRFQDVYVRFIGTHAEYDRINARTI